MTATGNFLVTGATGFIGRRLLARLEKDGCAAIGWTREWGDLRDSAAVTRVVGEHNVSTIVHLAACSSTLTEADWSLIAGEVAMVQNLASALPAGGRMVYAGSMSEHGIGGVISETDPIQPRTIYGAAKAAATDRAIALAATGSCDVRAARLFGVYGPGEGPQRLFPSLVGRLSRGETAPLGEASRIRDFIHVDDVCDVLITLADAVHPPHPVVNVGTGQGVSIGDVCYKVAKWLDVDQSRLAFGQFPVRAIDEEVQVADVSRLAAVAPVPVQHWLSETGPAKDYVLALATGCIAK
jgi:nucleoside-diphosphate-sugar epimerase